MRILPPVLALAVASGLSLTGLGASSATAAPAPRKAPAFQVSAAVSGEALVGKKITVKGRVVGPGAAKSPVTVQVRYGKGAWTQAAKVRTNARSAYTAKISLTKAGATSVRVVKPRSAKRAAGTSAPVALTVQKWIDLTQAPLLTLGAGLSRHAATIAGTRYASSLQAFEGGMYAFATGGACSRLELRFGFRDADRPMLASDASMSLMVAGMTDLAAGPSGEPAEHSTGLGAAKRVGIALGSDPLVMMTIQGNGYEADVDRRTPLRTVIAEPRVLCTVDALPEVGEGHLFGSPF